MHTLESVAVNPLNQSNGLLVPRFDVNFTPDMPADPDGLNDFRAQHADDALVGFARAYDEDEINLQSLARLLRTVGHWCDRNGVSLSEALGIAAASYTRDTDGEGHQF